MNKTIYFDAEARAGLIRGADQLANAVKVTLGAKGRNVTFGKIFGPPGVTKDGVTVAKEINLSDPFENMGAQMVKEVASKTNDLAGDGTTTATVLAQAILAEGFKNIAAGADPGEIKRGMDIAVAQIVALLEKKAIKVGHSSKKIEQIATISANNDQTIGKLIAQAFAKVGNDGVIRAEKSKNVKTYVEQVDGMQIDSGYVSPYFITDSEKGVSEHSAPYVLVTDKEIQRMTDLMPALEPVIKLGRPLVVFCSDIQGEALSTMIVNKMNQAVHFSAIKAPGHGQGKTENLLDIAAITGATMITEDLGLGLHEVNLDQLGQAEKITSDRNVTTIVNGGGSAEEIKSRGDQIKDQINRNTSKSLVERLKDRLAKLNNGVAVLYVGGNSEVEINEKRDRVDDALHATKAAVEEGVVVGGGVALLNAANLFDTSALKEMTTDEATGAKILLKAVQSPLRTIVQNAGGEPSVVIERVLNGDENTGYNVKTEKYVDMMKEGIIDPKKVTRVALENAASVAGMILTTECVVVVDNTHEHMPFQAIPQQ